MGVFSKLSALSAVVLGVVAEDPNEAVYHAFQEFLTKYGKNYKDMTEHNERFAVFAENYAKAIEKNAASLKKHGVQGGNHHAHPAKFGVTKFSDMTAEEFRQRHLGYQQKNSDKRRNAVLKESPSVASKVSKDWRGTLAVTPMKNQGACGSCWAFSATEAIETGYWANTGKQAILSAQQVTSCDGRDGGCDGGDTYSAYKYVEEAGGLESEHDYPYTSGDYGNSGYCKADRSKEVVKISRVNTISQIPKMNGPARGESNMYSEIQKSPMSICIAADAWQMYTGGVMDAATCGNMVDHCVQVVGVNHEEGSWIVKNQWGGDWGENGYIRLTTGENTCNIASEVTTIDAVATNNAFLRSSSTPGEAVFV